MSVLIFYSSSSGWRSGDFLTTKKKKILLSLMRLQGRESCTVMHIFSHPVDQVDFTMDQLLRVWFYYNLPK